MNNRKVDVLYNQLKSKIALMDDGQPFPTLRELMAEFSVSQLVVTSALNRLKERGLLESVPRNGSFVRKQRAGGRPLLQLIQSDWPSSVNVQRGGCFREQAEKYGFDFSLDRRDYHEDICFCLDEYTADIIVLDGVTSDRLSPRQLLALTQSAVPVILSNVAVPVEGIRYICGDNATGGGLAARYLVEKGHRKLGFLFSEPHLLSTEARWRNFEMVASACGCEITMLDCRTQSGGKPDRKIHSFMKKFVDGEYDFTALFAVSTVSGAIARRCLREFGVDVPGKVSILGFGDAPDAETERLSIVDISHEFIAAEVMKMSWNILNRKESFLAHIDVPPSVVDRGSVAIAK